MAKKKDKDFNFPELDGGKPSETPQVEEKTIKNVQKIQITLDTPTQEVLSLDQGGEFLVFNDGLDTFKCLLPQDAAKLNKPNRDRYFMAFGAWNYEKQLKEKNVPSPVAEIKISPRLASATQRLEVPLSSKLPGMHYCWKRTDTLRNDLASGYVIANEAELESFGSSPGNRHTVTAMGEDEMVLLRIPQEAYDTYERSVGEKSQARVEGVEAAAKRELSRDGGIPYDPDEDNRRKSAPFGPTNPSSRGS